MKTKRFLLATAGATVDGRTIDADMLRQMAEDYDPKTYAARLNIEHIRGISPSEPFNAKGDVLDLAVEDVELTIGGQKETRTALFGTFDVLPEAKKLNEAGQKVYPSIEINPNFAGKGRAYLMGVALTDSPASIGTERLQFNRRLPDTLEATAQAFGIDAAVLEMADEPAPVQTTNLIEAMTGFFARFGQKEEPKPEANPEPKADQVDVAAALKDGFTALATAVQENLTAASKATETALTEIRNEFATLKTTVEATPNAQHKQRPQSNGNADYSRTDF